MASTDNTLVLSDLTVDFDQFVDQFQNWLDQTQTWKGNLTVKTSATLIQLASSVGTFMQGRLTRVYEDAFPETAQSDDAVRSAVQMQGLRMARYLPAQMTVTLTSPFDITVPVLSQFTCGGGYFFNRAVIQLPANVPTDVTLYQGNIVQYVMPGLGTPLQAFISPEGSFSVSDQDVQVQVNGVIIPKTFGGLWNNDGLPGYADLTLPDGRALMQFGNTGGQSGQFGTIPQINDIVVITYPQTTGEAGNNLATINKTVSLTGFGTINGIATSNPTGGANDTPIQAYKNVASGGFGTYSSAVTKSQYQATIATYPGIVDAVTQAQREINPQALQWMNVIRVSGLTQSPWTQAQKKDFTDFCQSVTMYAPYFLWVDPIAIPRDVSIDVYCFNSAVLETVKKDVTNALQSLFAPRPGLLMTNFYLSDLEDACKASASGSMISYVIINTPTGSMIVTAPQSPQITYQLLPGGGSLGPLVYAYSVSTILTNGEEGPPSNWVFPQITSSLGGYGINLTWPAVANAANYKIWGRSAGGIGLLTEVGANVLSFTDNGSLTPSGAPPNTISELPIRYNSLNSLTVNTFYAERQQRLPTSTLPTRQSNG